ncbi:hypothetical protein ACFPRL_25890 [Pseudoclavibacter helvolus]
MRRWRSARRRREPERSRRWESLIHYRWYAARREPCLTRGSGPSKIDACASIPSMWCAALRSSP